jgi:hypothetical protein
MIDTPPAEPYPITEQPPAVGTYSRISEVYEISVDDGGLRLDERPTSDSPDPEDEPQTYRLVPVGEDHFVGRSDHRLPWTTYSYGTFTAEQNPAGGDYLYTGTRLTPRSIPAADGA